MDSGPEIEAHRHKTGHSRADLILALLAIVLSAISLWVAMKHGEIMERMADANARMVTASSWPNIRYSSGNYDPRVESPAVIFRLRNSGVGPARIESLELIYRGRHVTSWNDLISICCRGSGAGRLNGPVSWITSDVLHEVIPAGETIELLNVRSAITDPRIFKALLEARNDVAMRICYCSVFDECWEAREDRSRPEKVKECRPSPRTEFRGSAGATGN